MPLTPQEMKARTKKFALRIIRLFRALPKTTEAQIIGRQLLRSGTAVAANYRATCRARSRAEFLSRISVVVEEADETVFWMEMLTESGTLSLTRMEEIIREAQELLAIFAASQRTARARASMTR